MTEPVSNRDYHVDERVQVERGDETLTGTIAFAGETQFATGKWYGVILDQPKGKNNGSVKDVKYFECDENYGLFVRNTQIQSLDTPRRGSSATSLTGSTTSLQSQQEPSSGTSSRAETAVRKSEKSLPKPSGMKPPSSLPGPGKVPPSRLSVGGAAPRKSSIPASTSVASIPKSGSATDLPAVQQLPPKAPETLKSVEKMETPLSESKSIPEDPEIDEEPVSLPVQQERRGSVRVEERKLLSEATPVVKAIELSRSESLAIDQLKQKREYEAEISRLRSQVEQLDFHKMKMSEVHADLQKQLHVAQREAREAKDAAAASEDITELHETIEMLTLDKEMAEEKRDQLEHEMEDLKLKHEETALELEILKHECTEGGKGEAATSYKVVELQKQIDKLTGALIKLRDINAEEKHEKQKLQKEVKSLEDRNDGLVSQVDKYKNEAVRNEELLVDMREQVDAALGSEEMIERLTDQKLNMEDKLEELQIAVNDYESLMSMNNEMIDIARLTERQLREDLDMARAETHGTVARISELQQAISDSGITLHKFRDLTRQLQEENSNLRDQLQITSTQTTPTLVPLTIDYRLRIQDDKLNADRVDHKMLGITGKVLAKKLDYIALYMPDLYSSSREEAYINISIIPEQIGLKLALVGEEVDRKFQPPPAVVWSSMEAANHARRDEVVYAMAFTFFIKVLEYADRDVDYAIRTASPEIFAVLSELESQLQRQDDSIQYYVDLLKQGRLDESISLEYLDTSATQMEQMILRLGTLGITQRSTMGKLKDAMDILSAAAKAISAVSFGLRLLSGDAAVEVTKWLAEFSNKSEEIIEVARKIKRPLETDNELRAVMLPETVQNQLKPLVEGVQRNVALVYAWYRAVSHQNSLQLAEKGVIDGNQLKNILYAENDRGNFYKIATASPQQSVINSLEDLLQTVRGFLKQIDDGEWIRGSVKVPEMPKHPLRFRADALKKCMADAEELRSKIVSKDEEILEIRKNLRVKFDEVSELQLRRNMTEKKLENASKTEEVKSSKLHNQVLDLTSRLQKLQNDYDNETNHLRTTVEFLENEKQNLEKKLGQISTNFIASDLTSGNSRKTGRDGQVDVLRQVISSLRAEVVAVKGTLVDREFKENLPPLKAPAAAKRDPVTERVGKLSRQLASLETEQLLLLSKTAVDLTQPKDERDKLLKMRRMLDAEIRLKMRKIEEELTELSKPAKFFSEVACSK